MTELTLDTARSELMALQRKLAAYSHALGLLQYDGATSAPAETAENRGAAFSVLSEEVYRLSTSADTVRLLEYLDANKNALTQKENRMVFLLLKDLRDMQKIPMQEFIAYQELLVKADDVWHKAKEASDFALFCPLLEEIFETNKRFAGSIAPETDP